jgi:hypothetical protein
MNMSNKKAASNTSGVNEVNKPSQQEWTEKYVQIALATEDYKYGLDDIRPRIEALYAAANLERPRVALVQSPTQAQVVAGFSALILEGATPTLTLPASMYPGDYAIVQAVAELTGLSLPAKRPRLSKAKFTYFTTCAVQSEGIETLAGYFGLGQDGVEAARAARGGLRVGSNAAGDHAALAYEAEYEPKEGEDYARFRTFAWVQENTGGAIYGERVCVVFRRPTFVNVVFENGQAQPHYEHGPYIRYAGDGCGIYALEGVFVEGWIVETPADKMSAQKVLAIENADQRAVAMKKIGYAALKDALKVQVLHTGSHANATSEYELWTMEVEGRRVGPYLKMINPTTGITHVEGVPSTSEFSGKPITTVEEALAWRAGRKTFRKPLWVA